MRKGLLAAVLLLLALMVAGCAETVPSGAEQSATETHIHSFGAWSIVRTSTCMEKGERERVCACGEVQRETLSIGAHTPVQVSAVAPTCTEAGHGEGLCCSVCGDFLSGQSIQPAMGHSMVTVAGIPASCTAQGRTVGAECSRCGEVLAPSTPIPAVGHQPAPIPEVASSCRTYGSTGGTHCAICHEMITPATVLPLSDHVAEEIPTLSATCVSTGHSGGTQCRFCGEVLTAPTVLAVTDHTMHGNGCIYCDFLLIDYSNPDLYASHVGYQFLGTLTNGEALQTFYRRLDEVARTFHTDTSVSATNWVSSQRTRAKLTSVSYQDLKLTKDDLRLVFSYLHMDRPLYYWMANSYSYNDSRGTFELQVDAAYAAGEDRAYYNSMIYAGIEKFTALTEGMTSAYDIALTYHDALIAEVDYTYESDGRTPSEEIWAHRITGILLDLGAVCDSYAKTFQLLLNYSGVENAFVKGMSGGRHAWNLVRLDDGEWYWCDLTWDDTGKEYDGVKYQYFCVSDNEYINWADARMDRVNVLKGTHTFLAGHTPFDISNEDAWDRLYDLPARAATSFALSSVIELGETFKLNGMTFARWDADEVSLVSVDSTLSGSLTVPDTVTYDGRTYTVSELCAVDAQGYFHSESAVIRNGQVTEIVLPSSLQQLRYGALSGNKALTRVTLPRALSHIANDVFRDCVNLREICFAGTMQEWEQIEKDDKWDRGLTGYTVICSDGTVVS